MNAQPYIPGLKLNLVLVLGFNENPYKNFWHIKIKGIDNKMID